MKQFGLKELGSKFISDLIRVISISIFSIIPSSSPPEHGTPTSVAFVTPDPSQVVVSFDGGETLLYDLNTEQSIMVLETQTKDGESQGIPGHNTECSGTLESEVLYRVDHKS